MKDPRNHIRSQIGFNPHHTNPTDIVAKRVVFDDGDRYDPCVKDRTTLYSTVPLPIRSMDKVPIKVRSDPNFKDYTGFKFGNFTVKGLFALHKFDKWVVQCCCGSYEIRRTTVLNKSPTAIDQTRCISCMDLERLRARDYFKKHGEYPWQTRKSKNILQ